MVHLIWRFNPDSRRSAVAAEYWDQFRAGCFRERPELVCGVAGSRVWVCWRTLILVIGLAICRKLLQI